ncbi:Reduced folate carrier family and Major facilitator superfamily domain, general substrate transporter-containing protein [Strongyloides ratti]|uniref:Reduced folate carrier family and Major facilitator superfamily domain, general substrate transporter-containing protein n=1 Tax=Strongyloides ratti TaxID=34506 RepID=A0A090LF51_STRRB|nr:Reduced folate carrier family and Major facilitator superfamily domain, general substrate transporter-containing protein [Strongyloides ratti]CEF68397.1 Reduced folate carrier family and Major facilitator superfamily domain, general substrate transporter-containing protein [Strongyloides ratti]
MKWYIITAFLLTSYGFLKEFRPTEPYLYDYEIHVQNLSDSDLNNKIYPWSTYSYMIFLIPVFFFTDVLLYKVVLALESICFIVTWALIIFEKSVASQVLMQIFYGGATATEIAYFSYIYAYYDEKYYRKLTIGSRVSLNFGKCVSYFFAQLIIQNNSSGYSILNYTSLGSLILAFIFVIFLPNIDWKKLRIEIEKTNKDIYIESYKDYALFKIKSIWKSTKQLFNNQSIYVWSLWWILSTCGNFQIGNYIQPLWASATDYSTSKSNYNGLIEAICPLLSIITIFITQWIISYKKYLSLVSIFLAAGISFVSLLIMSYSTSIFVMYALYLIYRVIYQAMITVSQYEISMATDPSNLGFTFGVNTFFSLVLQSLLTFIVADKTVLGLPIRKQFMIYAYYHLFIFILLILYILYKIIKKKK